MTDIGEIVAFEKEVQSDEFCRQKKLKQNPGWEKVIDGIDGGKGDAKILADNLHAAGIERPKKPDKKQGKWDIDSCDTERFPWQAHHLVPEKQLPKHQVTFYLAANSDFEDEEYVLHWDSYYDTNGWENGRFMPFASTSFQWSECGDNSRKKKQVCYNLMQKTKRQLHQGPHAKKDYGEDPDTESDGYKKAVDKLLEIVYWGVVDHLDLCDVCKSDAPGGKKWVQPLESTVRHVNKASDILETLLIADKIWVSKRAYSFYAEVGYD